MASWYKHSLGISLPVDYWNDKLCSPLCGISIARHQHQPCLGCSGISFSRAENDLSNDLGINCCFQRAKLHWSWDWAATVTEEGMERSLVWVFSSPAAPAPGRDGDGTGIPWRGGGGTAEHSTALPRVHRSQHLATEKIHGIKDLGMNWRSRDEFRI